jgi:hypothetical protein
MERYTDNQLPSILAVAGTIFGMANTLSSLGGFLSSLMVGMLTQDNVSAHHNKLSVRKTQTFCITNNKACH